MRYVALLLWLVPLAIADDTRSPPEAPPDPSGLIVHEWGTFTTMQGADGVVLDGLHHEEESLPRFVYHRSRGPEVFEGVQKKMETPVTYFYGAQLTPARVRVGFPKGVLTQWYPMVKSFAPAIAPSGAVAPLSGGELVWDDVLLVPRGHAFEKRVELPVTDPGDGWRFAREVDAMTIRALGNDGCQWEKFLFYRGLGRFELAVDVQSLGGGRLRIRNRDHRPAHGALVLQVEDGRAAFVALGELAPGSEQDATCPLITQAGEPLAELVPRLQAELVSILVARGLYGREAWAMVRTWTQSYFHTPGLRLLYCLPQSATDEVIPLEVTPTPASTVRVMVARIECLTREHEASITGAVRDLGHSAFDVRESAHRTLHRLGRFAEPNLRRVLASTDDMEVRSRVRSLLDSLAPSR